MEYNLFGLGGSEELPSGTDLTMNQTTEALYKKSDNFC